MSRTRRLKTLLCALTLLTAHGTANATTLWANPVNLGSAINSSAVDGAPSLTGDGLTLFFHSDRTGGTGQFDLYMATRAGINSPWNSAINLGATLNSAGDDRAPAVSHDGLTLVFTSDRMGNGDRDLYITTRSTTSDPWSTPSLFGPTFETPAGEGGPEFSTDGLTMYYHSDRNNGNTNLRSLSRATKSDPWGSPAGLGSTVNSSPWFDMAPSISSDGLTLYFHSDRPGGAGNTFNIWATQRTSTSASWGTPYLVSTFLSGAEVAFAPEISPDGQALFFSSDGIGATSASRDIWMVAAVPVPAAVWLFGSGLLGLLGVARRKRAQYQ